MIRRHPVARAVLGVLVVALLGVLLRPLTPVDETRYLAVAWEMHLSGDWLVPTKNFAPYSDKPPLLFWAINLVWMLTGVSELAGRMVVPILAGVAIRLTATLARRLWPDEDGIGGRAALSLAGLVLFPLSGSLTMFDIPLSVAVLAGMLALVSAGGAMRAGRFGVQGWAGFGAAIALGALAKGPVILFHLLPAALLLPLWSQGTAWRRLPLQLTFGLAVGGVLVSLWLVPAAITGGAEYREAILWHQSAGRLADSFAHARPWWLYLALLPVLVFPLGWSRALWQAGRRADWRGDAGLRLCTVWGAGALVLFSLTSGKQVHYLVPELPALALVAARLLRGVPRPGLEPAVLALAALAAVAVLAGAGILPLGDAEALFAPRSALLTWALLIFALCWVTTLNRHPGGAMLLSLGTLLATNVLIGSTGMATLYSSHPIAAVIGPAQDRGLAYMGARYQAEFSFAARLTAPVATPQDAGELRLWMAGHPQGLILGPRSATEPPWQPQETIRFRSGEHAIWSVEGAPDLLQEQ